MAAHQPVAQSMSLEHLSRYFHLPINDVAKELGVCATVLKKICRRNGIPRWPHRKIKSFEKRISNLEAALTKNPEEEARITQELAALKEKKAHLMRNPGVLGKSQKRAPSSGISKHGLKRGPLTMNSDSESDEDDEEFRPSAREVRPAAPAIPETRATEQLAAIQRRAALLSVMGGNITAPSAPLMLPAVLPPLYATKPSVLEPSPLSYLPPSFSLLSSQPYRAAPAFQTPVGLAPFRAQQTERETDGLDALAELSKVASLEATATQDDTWRGTLVSHTGRQGVASSARVLV